MKTLITLKKKHDAIAIFEIATAQSTLFGLKRMDLKQNEQLHKADISVLHATHWNVITGRICANRNCNCTPNLA